MKVIWLVGCGAILWGISGNAVAALITPTTIAFTGTASETYPDENNLINGSGLSGTPTDLNYTTITHASAATGNAWVTTAPNGSGDFYLAAGSPTVVFQIGLGASYSLTDFIFWGYAPGSPNGNEARAFTLDFSTDGGVTFPTSVSVSNPLGTTAALGRTTFSLGGTFNANTVRLTVTDNHFGGPAGGDRVGLGEIRFLSAAAVPEPSSIALLVIGLGGALALGRLRRS